MKEEKSEKYKRPSWDEYFLKIAEMVGTRGTCDRGRNGAVLVKNKRILTTGYVGSPMGLPHCDEVGHMIHDVINIDGKITKHCIRTVHADRMQFFRLLCMEFQQMELLCTLNSNLASLALK